MQCQDPALSRLSTTSSLVRKKAELIEEMKSLGMEVPGDTKVVTTEVALAA
jgi:hypothetical protein